MDVVKEVHQWCEEKELQSCSSFKPTEATTSANYSAVKCYSCENQLSVVVFEGHLKNNQKQHKCAFGFKREGLVKIGNLNVSYGLYELHTALSKGGLNKMYIDTDGWAILPLHFASFFRHEAVIRTIFDLDPITSYSTIVDNDSNSLLHMAAYGGCVGCVETLVNRGTDVNATNFSNITPVLLSSHWGHVDVSFELIRLNADIKITDNAGLSGLHHVCIKCVSQSERLLQYFVNNGIDVDIKNKNGSTPLHIASSYGNPRCVSSLIDRHANVNAMANLFQTPISLASIEGYNDVIELLIASKSELNNAGHPLGYACMYGRVDTVRILIENGAYVNFIDYNGYTAILYASLSNSVEIVKLLIQNNATIDYSNYEGISALHLACSEGSVGVVKVLLDHNVDVNVVSKSGNTPLHYAVEGSNPSVSEVDVLDIVALLLDHNAHVLTTNQSGETPFEVSVRHFDEVSIQLLKHYSDLNQPDHFGRTPLHQAAIGGNPLICQKIIDMGGLLDLQDYSGSTPVSYASSTSMFDLVIVEVLVKNGANLNIPDNEGATPIILTCKNGNIKMTEYFIKTITADITHTDNYGRNSLHYASHRGVLDQVDMLIYGGIDVNTVDKWKGTALQYSIDGPGIVTVTTRLLCADADVNIADDMGRAPIHFISKHQHTDIARLILEGGANVDTKTHSGETPLLIAVREGNDVMVKFLIENNADVTIQDIYGRSCLHAAVSLGNCLKKHQHMLEKLCEAGGDANARDAWGASPIHLSTRQCIPSLLRCGANIYATDKLGLSALHYAMKSNTHSKDDIIQTTEILTTNANDLYNMRDKFGRTALLLGLLTGVEEVLVILAKSDMSITDDNGDSILHYASRGGDLGNMNHALENAAAKGVEFSHQNYSGLTVLHSVGKTGRSDILMSIISKGHLNLKSYINSIDKDGNTALHLACLNNNLVVAILLLSIGADINIKNTEGKTPSDLALESGLQLIPTEAMNI
eukprot:GHVR01078058.1.p1 GENE.GHVR01078058.1~~GHVR01078058.1.p1  ORF type:complete len:993 (+),score=183.42 GHVR01078058.1:31-2979(+)